MQIDVVQVGRDLIAALREGGLLAMALLFIYGFFKEDPWFVRAAEHKAALAREQALRDRQDRVMDIAARSTATAEVVVTREAVRETQR